MFRYNIMTNQTFLIKRPILFFYICILFINSLTASSLNFTANQKRSYVGRCIVNIPSQTLAYGNTNWKTNGPIITIPMPTSLTQSNSSLIQYSASIGDLQTYSLSVIDVFIFRISINQTQIQLSIATGNSNQIKKLTINYLVYLKETQYNTNFQIATINYYFGSLGTYISNSPSSYVYLYTNITYPVNTSNSFNTLVMLSGLSANYNINNLYDISFSSFLLNSTHTETIMKSKISEYTIVYQIILRVIIYIQPILSNQYRFYHGSIIASSGNMLQYNSSNNQMGGINTFVGLNSLSLYYQTEISFFMSVNESMGIVITTNNYFSTANSLTFSYLIIQSYYCDYLSPYLQSDNQMCYSNCPKDTVQNNVTLSCQCLINGSQQINNSLCMLNKVEISTSSSSNSQMGIIIGASIGSVVLIAILIIYCVYKNCPNNNSSLKVEKSITKSISFHSIRKNNELDHDISVEGIKIHIQKQQQQRIEPLSFDSNEITVQQPQFNSLPENKKEHQSQVPKREKVRQQLQQFREENIKEKQKIQWIRAQKRYSSKQICCACLKQGTFLQSQCLHSFHLTHLFQWIRMKNTCPLCRQQFNGEFKYFCNVCCKKYRIVRSNEKIDQNNFQRTCEDCPI